MYISLKNDKVWTSATLATLATYLSLKMIYIFKNDKVWIPATLAALATYLFLKMICIFKNDKVWTTATLATLATYLFLKTICIYLWKMTKSEHPQPSQLSQPIYLWKWYVSLKMTKSEHPQPSQPIYFWKWYVYIFKKWQSLNIRNPRNPRNLFIFENDMYISLKNDKVWTSATLATLATYLSLKMICIFKKMTKSEHLQPSQPSQPIDLWKWYISLKMTKIWTPATLATLATYLSLKMIYIFKNDKVWTSATLATLATYLSLEMICIFKKMTKSEHPQPWQPLQPIYLWEWYISLKKWQGLNIRNPRNPCKLFIFENDISFDKWQSLNLRIRNLCNPCNLVIFETWNFEFAAFAIRIQTDP